MTEYDYSPAAYERVMQTQFRVSNWVSSQSNHLQSYQNPFVPSAYNPPKPLPQIDTAAQPLSRSRSLAARPSPITTSSSLTPSRSKTHTTRSHKTRAPSPDPMSIRSRTMPPPGTVAAQQPRDLHLTYPGTNDEPSPSNRHSTSSHHRSHRSSNRSPSSRTRSHSHSHSQYHNNHHSSATHTNSVSHRTVAHIPSAMDRDSPGRKIIVFDSNVVQLPPPRHGEQYVIIPPPGGTVEILPMSSRGSGPAGDYDHDLEKRGRKEQPRTGNRGTWVQRLFGSLTRSGGSSNSNPSSKSGSGSEHHSSHQGHYRRSSY